MKTINNIHLRRKYNFVNKMDINSNSESAFKRVF